MMADKTGTPSFDEVIEALNARMLAVLIMSPFTLGPAPLMCPVCGTTRDACLRFYGRDRQHEEAIRAALDLGRRH